MTPPADAVPPAPAAGSAAAPAPAPAPESLPAFARANAAWLGAGALMTFASSFGQTFFIALFAGGIMGDFGLSHGQWGLIYTLGTLGSAAAMLWAGALADRFRAGGLTAAILLAFAAVCLGAALVPTAWALVLVIFGLRFCGQGMLYHVAIVSMGRWFARARGRAVAIANLGIAVGEGLLPVAFAALILGLGWRGAWGVAAVLLLLMAPLAPWLLRRERTPRSRVEADETPGLRGRHWTRAEALRHWLFWATLPAFLVAPVFSTAYFFHQVHLTQVKGWDFMSFAALYPLYVAGSIPMMFLAGWAIDRWGVGRVAPLWPGLLAAGMATAASFDGLWAAALTFALLGTMQGTGAAISGAWWPDRYGTKRLGAIRSMAVSAMVFATAIGPGITGGLLDLGVGFEAQLAGMAVIAAAMAALFALADRRARREAAAPA